MCCVHFVLKVENCPWKFYMKAVTDKITHTWRPSEDLRTLPNDGNFWQAKLQKYQHRLTSYISCQMLEISDSICKFWGHIKIHVFCQMLKMSHSWKYILHVEALWQSVICRLPTINCRWSYTSVDAILEKKRSFNWWKILAGTSMYTQNVWRPVASVRFW
jgi:hypothetical protein